MSIAQRKEFVQPFRGKSAVADVTFASGEDARTSMQDCAVIYIWKPKLSIVQTVARLSHLIRPGAATANQGWRRSLVRRALR